MGLLAKKGGGDEDDGAGFGLSLDRLVCPTCGREMPPWQETCPDDGSALTRLGELPADGPPVPSHLLEDLEDAVMEADEGGDDPPEPHWPQGS